MILLRPALLVAVLATPALSQQFVDLPGIFPGASRWSEGVEMVDVDHDGDLDVIFAEGDGFSSAGTKRPNRLYINQWVETGSLSFTDESAARLGGSSNAKGVTTADVNGDGWVDILFANAFNTDPPFLYINQGASAPGFFTLESAARGLTTAYSSAGAQFGDVDDDGDLDLVLCDSGVSFLGGSGASPVLYKNDGSGHFTLDAAFVFPPKKAHMDVQFEDIDLDWDLDCLVFCRANNGAQDHYLLLGDGTGAFSDASNLIPSTSGNVYEAEVGDLDGDMDHDLFFVSLSSFDEGAMRNEMVETGMLNYIAEPPINSGTDDNEIALFDWDNDGDYDVIVGSLGPNERAYRNNGGLSFKYNANRIQKIADSTLDLALGDVDGDGAYDLVTAQGESGGFTNRLYRNTGAPDDVPPVVVALDLPSALQPATILHARVRDQVRDDGVDYVTGAGFAAEPSATTQVITFQGGVFSPAALSVLPGQRVEWRNLDATSETVTSISPPYDYDFTLPPGGSVERTFVAGGIYSYQSTASGATGSVVVGAGWLNAKSTRLGGEVHRLEFTPTGTEASLAVELLFVDGVGNTTLVDGLLIAGGLGTSFCEPAAANSTGSPGQLLASGSDQVADNDFTLTATSLPQNQFGYFVASQGQTAPVTPPGSQGNLCLGGGSPILRFTAQVGNSGAAGTFSATLDLANFPPPYGGAVLPGQTWSFEGWYRDHNPTATSNFTQGVAVLFL